MEKLKIVFAVVLFLGRSSAASLGVVQTEGGDVQGQNIPLGLFCSVETWASSVQGTLAYLETTVCGTSMLPSPGRTGTSARLEESLTTSPSLESLQVELVSASRSLV